MSVFGYCGKPGTGKSYGVVENVIIPALKAGRTIYHNMALNEGPLRALAGHGGNLIQYDDPRHPSCTPAQLVRGAPLGALIVIDESVNYWPAGIKVAAVPVEERKFFTEHRHRTGLDGRATDIVVIGQEFGSQCAAFIRELIEYTYRSTKYGMFGFGNKYRVDIYEGCAKGDSPPQSKLIRKVVGSFRKEIFACYVSHTKSATGAAGEELYDDKRASIWRSWQVYGAAAGLLLLPAAAALTLHSFHALAHGKGAPPAVGGERSDPPTAAVAHTAPGGVQPVTIAQDSKAWRFAGSILRQGKMWFVVEGDHGGRLLDAFACTKDVGGNTLCLVDGQRVAEWTGPEPTGIERLVRDHVGDAKAVEQ